MHTIRDLLDILADDSADTIRRLCDIRQLNGRGKAAQCTMLARSYRGDYTQFFDDLLKKDLVYLLGTSTDIDGIGYYLPYAKTYPKDQLISMALRLFRDGKVPKDLAVEEDEDEDEDDGGDSTEEHEDGDRVYRERYDPDVKGEDIRIFISHSAKDLILVRAFVNCLEACLEVPDKVIRCTSLPGYKLLPGEVSEQVLRDNIEQCLVVVGVLTDESLSSGYVIMELGAAWGLEKYTCALLAPEVEFSRMPGPLGRLHAMKMNGDYDIASLMEVIAERAGLSLRNRARCTDAVSTFVTVVKEHSRKS